MDGMDGSARDRVLRVVSIGGGTGQPALIRALRLMARETGRPLHIDAVVAMADDGRSTGILREREGVLPPGDLRKCLVALAAEPDGLLARALEHRFAYLDGHAMGNLLLTALADEAGNFGAALAAAHAMLGCVGRALPSTFDQVRLAGRTAAGEEVSGQAALSYAAGRLDRVWLEPADPAACGEAVRAILEADLVVAGPGSLFTSIAPNLLVPGIADALARTRALRLFVCPKADVPGETEGMDAEGYADALERMGFSRLFDAALFHRADPAGRSDAERSRDPRERLFPDVGLSVDAERRLRARFSRVWVRDLADPANATAHDVRRFADALAEVVRACPSVQR